MKIKNITKLSVLSLLGLLSISVISSTFSNETLADIYVRNAHVNKTNKIKNVIMFIGDGMGPNHVDAGEIYLGRDFVFSNPNDSKWSFHGYQNTDSLTSVGYTLDTSKSLLRPELNPTLYDDADSPYTNGGNASGNFMSDTCYTDSAAGGTALATGYKTTNSTLGLNKHGQKLQNLVEIAHSLNKMTGVVTTDSLDGATPSSFLVHVEERHLSSEIVDQMMVSDANLIIGEKPSVWSDTTTSNYTLNGWDVATSLSETNPESNKEVIVLPGLVANSHISPSLSDLTIYALDKLDNDEGFFLMVEGASIDKASHSNQTRTMMQELLDFENAIMTATKWAEAREDTLMIVTADHETGGLYFNRDVADQSNVLDEINWLTYNHSRTRVGVDVYGDISEFVNTYQEQLTKQGVLDEGMPTQSPYYWDNTDVFRLAASYL